MKGSKILVVGVVVAIAAIVITALGLRENMRCTGFAGSEVTAAELPPPRAAAEVVRVAHFNLRNFPLDERPQTPDLGFSRRTNICDLETTLAGLDAQIFGFVEVCDRRRFPPILRRAGGDRDMRILFSQGAGRGGQHLAVAQAREKITAWKDDYNRYRPHSSLGNLTPQEFSMKSRLETKAA